MSYIRLKSYLFHKGLKTIFFHLLIYFIRHDSFPLTCSWSIRSIVTVQRLLYFRSNWMTKGVDSNDLVTPSLSCFYVFLFIIRLFDYWIVLGKKNIYIYKKRGRKNKNWNMWGENTGAIYNTWLTANVLVPDISVLKLKKIKYSW